MQLKTAQPASISDGGEASDSGDNGGNGDYCSGGLPITDAMDLASNNNATLGTIKIEILIKRKNKTESVKSKLEYIAVTRELMEVCFCCCIILVFVLQRLST